MRYSQRFVRTFSTYPIPTITFVVLTLICAALMSCGTNDTSVSPQRASGLGIGQFPLAIGNSWTYTLYDSMSNSLDTVSVRVENPNPPTQQFANIWVFKGTSYHDTLYVQVDANRVTMYHDSLALQPEVTIMFPLMDGASWGKSPDTTVVYSETRVAVPAGTFDDAFLVDRRAVSFNYRFDSQQWIVPDIGIVRWERKEFNLGPALNQRWVLLAHTRPQ